ncbi:hypothetical protein B0H19DRAFT_1154256 [Mycena capillaripes]|nr:hypothetical protein B0H19DRAFT_1154256 [Mycena capillaripes]
MMRVAWRVKQWCGESSIRCVATQSTHLTVSDWVESLLYRTRVFTASERLLDRFPVLNQGIFQHIVRTKLILLRDTVHNVMVRCEQYVSEAEVADIVETCPGIERLNLEVTVNTDLGMGEYLLDENYITRIWTIPPRHIHCDLAELIDSANSLPLRLPAFTLSPTWTSSIGLTRPRTPLRRRKLQTRLGELPRLTHSSVPSHTSNSDTPILAHLLHVCKSLRALNFFEAPPTPPNEEMVFLAENDVHFVTVWPHDGIADWPTGREVC